MNILTGDSYTKGEAERFLRRRAFWRQPAEQHDPYNVVARLAREYVWATKVRSLEVCCGDGLASTYAREEFEDTRWGDFYGIDGSEDLLARAPDWLQATQGDVHTTIWPNDLDLVLLPFCLYHVDPKAIFARAAESLKPGGVVIASWMLPDSCFEVFNDWLGLPHAWNSRLYWDMPDGHARDLGLVYVREIAEAYPILIESRAQVEGYVADSLWWRDGVTVPDEDPPAEAVAKFGYGVWRKA
jgi:SAM-dependent methyltransferase